MRGSKCARFEVHTVDGGEDMSNILLLMCDKGGALWNHTTIILYLLLSVPIDYDAIGLGKLVIIFNNQPGYGWLGYDYSLRNRTTSLT